MLLMFLGKLLLLVVVYAAATLLFCWGWKLIISGDKEEMNCYNIECQRRKNDTNNIYHCDCQYCMGRSNPEGK